MTEPQESPSSSTIASFSASKIGWISAAALSHLALVSAAVETFLSQSALRWWVLGAVALYSAAVIGAWRTAPGLWKRLTPTVLATSGVGLFLVLLAATAWLPGGQTAGIRLLGQTTPVLLAAVSAMAVALSGFALWRVRILPAWARYALAALSVYGAVAFVIGLVTVAPYASLFQGHSFWAVLPRWLQGAFVGGLLLIPLAIVAQIMRLVEQLRRKEEARGFMYRTAALGMVFLVALGAVNLPGTPLSEAMATIDPENSPQPETAVSAEPVGGPQDEAIETAMAADTPPSATMPLAESPDTPPPGEGSQSSAAETAVEAVALEDLGALVDLIVADAGDLPRVEFDPAVLAEALDRDPQKLFEWVRDHTWWAPYRGLLRGAKGGMLDRVGSSLDRAVLLGDLLRRAGHTVRLAHAQLPEDRARELLAKVRPIPDQRRSPVAPMPVSAERQRAIEAIMPGFEKALQEEIAASKRLADEAGALVRSQTDQLYAMVRDVATRDLATKSDTDDRAAIAALQDHWWVEREENGSWIAMDVLLPDAGMGDALAAASTTSEWSAEAEAPSIPETDWHTVRIRVVVERYEGGATTESVVLETTLRPVEVFERPVTLNHMPMPWPEEIPDAKTDSNALRNAALQATEWVPFLSVGGDLIAQSGFTDSGDVKTNPFDPIADAGGGGLFGAMDSALSGGDVGGGFATAEWLDYEIHVPGEATQRLRRPVFDLLGPARRTAQAAGFDANTEALRLARFDALWSRTDILLQPSEFTGEFVTHLMTASIVANQGAFRELSQERDPARAENLANTILERVDSWGPLPNLALWRSALSKKPRDWYVDRPNVLSYRVGLQVVNADRMTLWELIDIASNASGVRRGASQSSFEVRLQQGVADTVAEMLTLGSNLRMAENTASVFAMAGTGPGHGVRIGPRDATAVQKLGWSEDVAARLAQNIDAGYMAVVLKEPVTLHERQRVGWWRVDPISGETIGVMDTGFHAALTEDQIKRRDELRAYYEANKHTNQQYVRHGYSRGNGPKNVTDFMKEFWEKNKELRGLDALAGAP